MFKAKLKIVHNKLYGAQHWNRCWIHINTIKRIQKTFFLRIQSGLNLFHNISIINETYYSIFIFLKKIIYLLFILKWKHKMFRLVYIGIELFFKNEDSVSNIFIIKIIAQSNIFNIIFSFYQICTYVSQQTWKIKLEK